MIIAIECQNVAVAGESSVAHVPAGWNELMAGRKQSGTRRLGSNTLIREDGTLGLDSTQCGQRMQWVGDKLAMGVHGNG